MSTPRCGAAVETRQGQEPSMLPHPETVCVISAQQFQERLRDIAQDQLAAGSDAGARSRPPRVGSACASHVGRLFSTACSLLRRAGPRVSQRAKSAAFPNLSFVTTKPADRALTK